MQYYDIEMQKMTHESADTSCLFSTYYSRLWRLSLVPIMIQVALRCGKRVRLALVSVVEAEPSDKPWT